jgi:RNA polymerase sigma-70 factor (ECF subfamily)
VDDTTDAELIARHKRGDQAAFEQLVLRWDTRVLNLAYRLACDREEAREIRQIAFMRAYRGLAGFNGDARFSTWLNRVVVNIWRDRVRQQIKRRRDPESGEPVPDRPETGALPCPSAVSEQREAGRIVAEAVAALPDAEREVVALRHYQGLTFAEIAEVVDAPVSTVKTRMSRALVRLRGWLKGVEL